MRRPADRTDILNEIRQRRPIIMQYTSLDNSESVDETQTDERQSKSGASGRTWICRHLKSVRRALTVRLLDTWRMDTVSNTRVHRAT